jgi:geranylgeranyl diphosphate synthase type I
VLSWNWEFVDPALRAAVDTIPGSMRRIAGYHLGWWDEHGQPIECAAGKGIRSALVLLAAEAVAATRRGQCRPPPRWNWCVTTRSCTTM